MVPSIRSAITSGKTQVKVVNAAGDSVTCRIRDIGPGIRTGNSIDLTYATAHAVGTGGDAIVAFQVLA
jgi:rare lipoprotein A (peptidoglycan hydrolase)